MRLGCTQRAQAVAIFPSAVADHLQFPRPSTMIHDQAYRAEMASTLYRSSARGLSALQSVRSGTVASVRTAVRTMASNQGKGHYILQYKYVSDILDKRDPYRQGHLDKIKEGLGSGKLVVAGAIADPVDGGLLIFADATKDEVEAYAKEDPYTKGDLIESYTIRSYLRVQ